MKAILGRKVGMTQVFTEKGEVVPVTVIEAGPCYVTQVRTIEKDGYSAVQLGFDQVEQKRLTKGELGHLRSANAVPLRSLREFRAYKNDAIDWQAGDKVLADVFAVGDVVDILAGGYAQEVIAAFKFVQIMFFAFEQHAARLS